jgi:uncharacterized protein
VTIEARPVVLPVNFRLCDGRVLFRTGPGTKLIAAATDTVVAFEADGFNPVDHTGWSVLVTGIARDVTASGELSPREISAIPHWAPSAGEHVIVIPTTMIEGRRISYAMDSREPDVGIEPTTSSLQERCSAD